MFSCCFFAKSKKSQAITPTIRQSADNDGLSNGTFKINSQDIDLSKAILGDGSSSVVFHGKWKNTDVAIKQFDNDHQHEYYREKSIAENWINIGIKSNHIIQYYGCIEEAGKFSLVMEYLPAGDLADYVLGDTPPNLMLSLFIACDIARGLQWLKQYHIIHCDIKLENILLTDNFLAKITDFGSCILESESKSVKDIKGTPGFIAPEILKAYNKKSFLPYTYSSDVYAFGITLLEMVNSSSAYDNSRSTNSIDAEVIQGKRPVISDTCPENVANIIKLSFRNNPKQRPEITDITNGLEIIRNSMSI